MWRKFTLRCVKICKICKKLRCFLKKFTQLTKILHDRRSRRSRQIPSLYLYFLESHMLIFLCTTILRRFPLIWEHRLQFDIQYCNGMSFLVAWNWKWKLCWRGKSRCGKDNGCKEVCILGEIFPKGIFRLSSYAI